MKPQATEQPPTTPLLLKVERAAELLSVSPNTVFNLLQDGTLSRVKIRSGTRVLYEEIKALAKRSVLPEVG